LAPEEGFWLGAGEISHRLAGVGVVLEPLPGGRQEMERIARRQRNQSAAIQTAPKFGLRLRRRGRRSQNASGRWAWFFPAPIKNGPIRTSAVHLRRTVGDALNTSLIALIPKQQGADALQDYRPISLINSVVKIFSKILASCLAPKLDNMIGPSQSAFVKN
jgi:hypothetical protein